MKFNDCATHYARFETLSGNALRDAVTAFLTTVPAADIKQVVYMTLGSIASDYDNVNLGIAYKTAVKAIAQAYRVPEQTVLTNTKHEGDVGGVAQAFASAKKPVLTVADVFDTMHRIARTSGVGSQDVKTRLFAGLLAKATPLEARYISRLAIGRLQLGFASKTILDALAQAFAPGNKKELVHAFNICPDIGLIAQTLLKKKIAGIQTIGVVVGRPVQMMLCQRIDNLAQAFHKLGATVAAEQKYDGERVQIHKDGKRVVLYSRRLENITTQFPDVVTTVLQKVKARSCIMECEIMAVKNGQLQPFQTLMSRRRKHGVEAIAKTIPVKLFAFDLLYLNGTSIIRDSYVARYKKLSAIVRPSAGIDLARRVLCHDVACVQHLFEQVVGKGGEGVVIKSLRPDSDYQAGVRGWHWIKWKPEYTPSLRDTFDLVVVGAYLGRGRRAGGYGALLCAAYNDKNDTFESACKVGTGFTDNDLASLPKLLKKTSTQPKNIIVTKQMLPDVWIRPTLVAEIVAAEITKSPYHTVARTGEKGLALRFPRFIRWRDDKRPHQATTSKEIATMAKK